MTQHDRERIAAELLKKKPKDMSLKEQSESSREVLVRRDSIEEGFIAGEYGRIWYRIAGTDKFGVRPPVLCLHGGPGNSHFYMTPMEAFAGERPVILYDQLGGGNSDRPEGTDFCTMDYFAEEIDTVRQALGLDDYYLLGHSWGSMLASHYLLDRTQEGIRGAIFAGPCLSVRMLTEDCGRLVEELPEPHRSILKEAVASGDYDLPGFQEAMDRFDAEHGLRLTEIPDYVLESSVKKNMEIYRYMWGVTDLDCTGVLREYDALPRLSEIRIPSLYVCGEFDECTPASAKIFADATPGAELAVIKDASHMELVEKPEEFRKVLADWFARLD